MSDLGETNSDRARSPTSNSNGSGTRASVLTSASSSLALVRCVPHSSSPSCADQRRRWQTGDRIPAERYLVAFHTLRDNSEAAVELVCAEFLLREQAGEAPDPDEFVRRFPALGPRLRMQFDLHAALAETPSLQRTVAPKDAPLPGPRLGPGSVLGQYRLLEQLGEGGMGQVFKAVHTLMDRTVAVKFIRPDLVADPEAVRRFHREIRAVAPVSSPHRRRSRRRSGGRRSLRHGTREGINLARLVAAPGPLPVTVACI
jgi:hypothetical protein